MKKYMVLIGIIGLLASCNNTVQDKTGFIYATEIFNKYEGTKERTTELEAIQNQQKKVLDSLKVEVTLLEGKLAEDDEQLLYKKQHYNRILSQFAENNQNQIKQHDGELWTQINQYIADFGKEKGYTYIHGVTGQGNLMYADSIRNITPEVIDYINLKYQGK